MMMTIGYCADFAFRVIGEFVSAMVGIVVILIKHSNHSAEQLRSQPAIVRTQVSHCDVTPLSTRQHRFALLRCSFVYFISLHLTLVRIGCWFSIHSIELPEVLTASERAELQVR